MVKRRRMIIEELHEEEQTLLVSGGEDFQTCLDLFLKDMTMRNLAYHTKRWYKENLAIVKRALENLKYPAAPIHSTEKMLKDVIVYCMEQLGNYPTTINHRIRSMKQFYSFLHNESVIPNNPAQSLQKQKGKKEQIKPFTDDEVKDLLDQPNRKEFVGFRDYTIMLVLLDTGVRLCELVNMKITDISLESGKILVLGKGNKEREVMFQATTREQIRRYLKIRGSVHHDYLWVAHDDKPLARKTIQDRLKKYGEMARVNKRVSPHTFRHTCAKMYIMQGGDIFSLQQLLGHSSLEMCRHYVSLWGTDLQNMHRKFSPVERILR
jgi:integrase/recombinase XerD